MENCVNFSQVVSNFANVVTAISALIVAIGTIVTAWHAFKVYKNNSKLERAKWLTTLYEKFYEREQLKSVRDILDNKEDAEQIKHLVEKEEARFTDYLNFFELISSLKKREQLSDDEINDMFGYYLDCIARHQKVCEYIKNNGYEGLDDLLKSRNKTMLTK